MNELVQYGIAGLLIMLVFQQVVSPLIKSVTGKPGHNGSLIYRVTRLETDMHDMRTNITGIVNTLHKIDKRTVLIASKINAEEDIKTERM